MVEPPKTIFYGFPKADKPTSKQFPEPQCNSENVCGSGKLAVFRGGGGILRTIFVDEAKNLFGYDIKKRPELA